MKIKSLFVLAILIVALSGVASAAKAPFTATLGSATVTLTQVEVNDVNLDDTTVKSVDKTDKLEVLVAFEVSEDIEDMEITAEITGYDKSDRDKLSDSTNVDDIQADETNDARLDISLPERMEKKHYGLKITVDSPEDRATFTFPLDLDSPNTLVNIRDVILSPSNGVKAGRALLATVRVQNRGDSREEDVKVTFSIPELGISDSDFIDDLDADGGDDDSKSSEDLFLRIPQCAKEGVYEGEVEVEYNDGDDTVTDTMDVLVLADETCELDAMGGSEPAKEVGKTVIKISPKSQDVTAGSAGAVYPVTITNTGAAKTYTISVTAGDFGQVRVSPSNVVTVGRDDTESAFIHVTANAGAPEGEQVVGVDIAMNGETVASESLVANVVSDGSLDLKRVLEIGLIVLVVILVILGLIIGFNKLKGDEGDKEEGEAYY